MLVRLWLKVLQLQHVLLQLLQGARMFGSGVQQCHVLLARDLHAATYAAAAVLQLWITRFGAVLQQWRAVKGLYKRAVES
jgi:hypothetical protein